MVYFERFSSIWYFEYVSLTSSINGRLEHNCLSVYAGKIQIEEGNQKICSVGKKEAASACLA
jgi:hypothetical protein